LAVQFFLRPRLASTTAEEFLRCPASSGPHSAVDHLLGPLPENWRVTVARTGLEVDGDNDHMAYADDPDGYRKRLESSLSPESIRVTLGFAGLYQITYELIKQAVLERVKSFYWYDEEEYRREVLTRAPSKKFRASLLWLVEGQAITLDQADRLDAIYQHRKELAHELIRYIIDPDVELGIELFSDALVILKAIMRFWTSIEIDGGSFEHMGDVEIDDVVPASLIVLQQCLDAYVAGFPGLPGQRLGD
jgi:hypothetical protein